jgi:N-acetylglucosaminyl-diphospho-decaprenol L-rhamnosyltransferase
MRGVGNLTRPRLIITFACLNQVHFTTIFLRSLLESRTAADLLVAVDNGSNDETAELLATAGIETIRNRTNLGCGVAWNQGILARQAEWTIIMNNDVVVSPGWADNLLNAAERFNLQIASPAMIEGDLHYDPNTLLRQNSEVTKDYFRPGIAHAVCMAIHSSVFERIGYFEAKPFLFGFEDTLFFDEARKAEIPVGTVGASWIHHFGSVTQKWLKEDRGIPLTAGLGDRNNKQRLHQNMLERKYLKWKKSRALKAMVRFELGRFGHSLHGRVSSGANIKWI